MLKHERKNHSRSIIIITEWPLGGSKMTHKMQNKYGSKILICIPSAYCYKRRREEKEKKEKDISRKILHIRHLCKSIKFSIRRVS